MASSDTLKAQKYASIAEVAAATAKIYAKDIESYDSSASESAEAAATSASSAASSASLAEQWYSYTAGLSTWFLGSFSQAPTLRNDGSALQVGDMYKNTTDNEVYSYNSDGTWSNMTIDAAAAQAALAGAQSALAGAQEAEENAEQQAEKSGEYYDYTVQFYDYTAQQNYDFSSALAAKTGSSLIGGLGFLTPEMFGAVGDGVADDTAAIQAAINTALSSSYKIKVVGMGIYAISSSLAVNNFARGFCLDLAGLTVLSTFPTYTGWKDATPAILVGAASNGSQVGLEISIGYFNGGDKATLFRLSGYGAGGSKFHAGRVRNAIGVYQVGDHTLTSTCASNKVTGDYWYTCKFGIRIKRNGTYIVEGHKIQVGFMTGMSYGGIQLFNGAQYFQIYGTDLDFCGRYLVQLTVDQLPASDIRGGTITYNGSSFEVLDYYQQTSGVYCLLVIDTVNAEGGKSSFSTSVSTSLTDGTTTYILSAVTTAVTNNAYFDFIHGFQGAAFSRGNAIFGYLSNAVGGNWNGTTIYYNNSFQEITNKINNIWIRNQGTRVALSDRWTGTAILACDTTGDKTMTIPGGLITQNTSTIGGKVYYAGYRLFGSETAVTLTSGTSRTIRTFTFVGNGTNTATKEMWNVYVCGPTGLSGVGGVFQVLVGSSGIELFGVSGINYPTISVSGYALNAVQSAQSSMQVTFMFERKM